MASPGGATPAASSGTTAGSLKKNQVKQGSHEASVAGFKSIVVSKTKADLKETITCRVETLGRANGTPVEMQVYECDMNSADKVIKTVNLHLSGNAVTIEWKFPKERLEGGKPSTRPSLPVYRFGCKLNGKVIISDDLLITGDLKISVVDLEGKALKDEPVKVLFSNKDFKELKTDASGKVTFAGIRVGCHRVQFTRNTLIGPKKSAVVESPQKPELYPVSFYEENAFKEGFIAKCSHPYGQRLRMVINPQEFGVVPGVSKADKVEIYTNKRIVLTDAQNAPLPKEPLSNLVISKLDCKHTIGNSYMPFFAEFWNRYAQQTEYTVKGLSEPVSIKAFAPDKHKITINSRHFPNSRQVRSLALFRRVRKML